MPLKEAIAKKKEGENTGINHRPEVDAKIDKFIAENPDVWNKLMSQPKEDIARKRILDMVTANERRAGYSAEMREYVEQNPDIQREVNRRISKLPEDQRQRAYSRIANSVISQHSMRQGAAVAA